MRRLSRRARRLLALALCLAVAASAAGLVISRQGGSRAQAAAPGSTQTWADLSKMQSLLNSGSVSKQAALLVPPLKFAPGSKPIFPAGTTVTIKPGTLRPDGGPFGLVEASLSGGKTVTLGLYQTQGHWHLYSVTTGPAQTRAKIIPAPGSRHGVRLLSTNPVFNYVPTPKEMGTRTPVILIHGVFGHPDAFGSDQDPASMIYSVDSIRGTWVSAYDYSPTNGEWTDVNGPPFANYIRAVAKASRLGGGNGKVIVVGYSMGGLFTRWAATDGGEDGQGKGKDKDIAMVITIGTPNTGSFMSDGPRIVHDVICKTPKSVQVHTPYMSQFCADFTASAGLSAFGTKIAQLKELPSDIPLHAIAGDETTLMPLGLALVTYQFYGDAIVPVSSALHHRPEGGPGSYTVIRNRARAVLDFSAWHGALPKNQDVIAEVHDLIHAYVQAHPAPDLSGQSQSQQPASGHPAGPDGEDPLNVVYNYYDTLNAHDYQRAWELGGNNIAAQNGQTYDSWVAGYGSTKSLYITGQDAGVGLGNHLVQVSITVTQKDGSRQYYAGTYTVRLTDYQSWTITAADIHATSGPQPGPAPAKPLGGDSYWLAGGGQWYVHGAMLHITRGPSGLAGTETWNEYGQIVNGTIHLAFTPQADGSLLGIYTDDPAYIKAPGRDTSPWPGPGSYEPRKGEVIRLVPVAPHHAKTVYVSRPGPEYGNTNWCQAGLPDPSQYCGA